LGLTDLSLTKHHRILFLVLGIVLAIACFLVPVKWVILGAAGLAFAVFAFYRLEMAMGLFLLGMGIVPHQYWSNPLLMLGSLFFFAVYLAQVLAKKRPAFSIKDVTPAILVFTIFVVYAICASGHFGDAMRIGSLLLSAMLFCVLLSQVIRDEKSLAFLLDMVCFAVFLTAVFGIYQKMMGIEIKAEFIDTAVSADMPGRLYSTMNNANNYAEYLLLLLPLCFANFLYSKSEWKKLVIAGILAVGCYALLYTLSRGAYLGFAIGVVIYVLIAAPKLAPFFAILAVLAVPFLPDVLVRRVLTIGKDTSSTYRLMIWEGVFAMLKDYWHSGIGMGPASFTEVYYLYKVPLAHRAMHAHNLFLHIWLEMGIGGLLSFIGIILAFGRNVLFKYIHTKNKLLRAVLPALVFGVVGYAAYGMAEYVFFYPRVMFTFWAVIGIGLGAAKLPDAAA